MEPLHVLFRHAQSSGTLNFLHQNCANFRMSLYADDAAVFISPTTRDLATTKHILQIFWDASGLITNLEKTKFYLIRCHNLNLEEVFGPDHPLSDFPCTYLGLPLHYKKLPKSTLQPLIQRIGNRPPGWKRNLISYPGRELLVKTVLSAMPTHFLTVYMLPKWAEKEIDRYRRSFLWMGDDPDKVRGGHCLVKWKRCTRPKRLGGLGIKDLEKFRRALRLRWLWYSWDNHDRLWKNLLKHHDKTDRALFFASTLITVGDGKNTPFWEARWLNGLAPKELAPNLYSQGQFRYRTVHKELTNLNWIRNLKQINTEELLEEFIMLFNTLSEVSLNEDKDAISWRWTRSGEYTAASAYETQFLGAFLAFKTTSIWRAKVEPKCRFFAWLAIQGKAPTADNLMKKNWDCNPNCPLCYCMPETNDHLLTECNFTEAKIAQDLQVHPELAPFQKGKVADWLLAIDRVRPSHQQRQSAGIVLCF